MVQCQLRCVVCFYKAKYCGLGNMDKIRRLHREEKTGYRKWISKRYYDRPDGQDILGKLSYTTKMAAVGGTVAGFVCTVYPTPALDAKTKLLRVARVLVPSIGMAVMFTCVTYYSTNLRKKDDPLNYVLGGAAAGFLLGPATGVPSVGAFGALVLAAVGYAKKTSQLDRSRLIPPIKQKDFSNHIIRNWGFTLLEDTRRGNWVKEPPSN